MGMAWRGSEWIRKAGKERPDIARRGEVRLGRQGEAWLSKARRGKAWLSMAGRRDIARLGTVGQGLAGRATLGLVRFGEVRRGRRGSARFERARLGKAG